MQAKFKNEAKYEETRLICHASRCSRYIPSHSRFKHQIVTHLHICPAKTTTRHEIARKRWIIIYVQYKRTLERASNLHGQLSYYSQRTARVCPQTNQILQGIIRNSIRFSKDVAHCKTINLSQKDINEVQIIYELPRSLFFLLQTQPTASAESRKN